EDPQKDRETSQARDGLTVDLPRPGAVDRSRPESDARRHRSRGIRHDRSDEAGPEQRDEALHDLEPSTSGPTGGITDASGAMGDFGRLVAGGADGRTRRGYRGARPTARVADDHSATSEDRGTACGCRPERDRHLAALVVRPELTRDVDLADDPLALEAGRN